MPNLVHEAIQWYTASPPETAREVCPTRDIFQARLDTRYREIISRHLLPEDEAALLIAVLGEIGNNCFDHNLGQWRDAIGCWFSMRLDAKAEPLLAVIADRGQGILNSLKRVKTDLSSDEEALKAAFELRISGRSPEHRGNGLKFVRSVINGSENRGLLFFSGKASVKFGGLDLLEKQMQATGTLALIVWRRP